MFFGTLHYRLFQFNVAKLSVYFLGPNAQKNIWHIDFERWKGSSKAYQGLVLFTHNKTSKLANFPSNSHIFLFIYCYLKVELFS